MTTAFARSSADTIVVVADICSLFPAGGDGVELDGTELVIDCTTDDDDDDAPPGGEALIVAVWLDTKLFRCAASRVAIFNYSRPLQHCPVKETFIWSISLFISDLVKKIN